MQLKIIPASILFVCFTISVSILNAQVLTLRQLVDTLASPYMGGRGYVDSGIDRAANFIEAQMKTAGLQPVKGSFRQPFNHSINTFPGTISLSINGKNLLVGKDFLVSPGAKAVKTAGTFQQLDSIRWIDPASRVVVELVNKLTWSASTIKDDYTVFQILKTSMAATPQQYEAEVEADWKRKFTSVNIVGMIPGTDKPDSFLLLTAHYDHLGKMGVPQQNENQAAAVFRGANDNASGVGLLLHLANQIAQKPLRYSVVCIAFAGEELGLLGSKYFTEHPMVPLRNIRFLINMDMVGTGDDGIMAVNASEFHKEWQLLDSLNKVQGALKQVGQRGKAQNSDHYWFTEKGVPAFFIYTLGGNAAYHDVFDLPETLPLTKTQEVGKLVIAFFENLSSTKH